MTLICSSDDVSKLIREMQYWEDDPDLQRIADAIPLEQLERAYVKKLSEVPIESATVGQSAVTVREKIRVLRKILLGWLRSPGSRLGQMIQMALIDEGKPKRFGDGRLYCIEDYDLALAIEKRYPPNASPAARSGNPSPR